MNFTKNKQQVKNKDKIIVISGIVDFQKAGNQTIKQTIKYFSKHYDILMLSYLPDNYPNLDKAFEKEIRNLKVLRLPKLFSSIFFKVRALKNKFNQKKGVIEYTYLDPQKKVSYFSGYSKISLLLYNMLTISYLFLEFPRALYYALKLKPKFIYGYEKDGAILASFIGKLLKIPVIKRFQGTPLEIQDGNKIKDKFFLYNFIIAYKIFNYPIVMANDGTRGDKILELLQIPKEKTLFILNGLVLEDLENAKVIDLRKKFNLNPNTKIILMLSKLKFWKRVDRGLWLMHRIVKDLNRKDFTLIIVGDGEYKDYLKNLAKKLNIEEYVIFVGSLPHKEAMNYLKSCDVFWSLYDITNLGNPLLEAIFFEKPIFTLDNEGDLYPLLGKDYKGLVSLKDFFSIAEYTVKFFEDPTFRQEIIKKVIQSKSNLLSWEKRINKEIKWIEKFLR